MNKRIEVGSFLIETTLAVSDSVQSGVGSGNRVNVVLSVRPSGWVGIFDSVGEHSWFKGY